MNQENIGKFIAECRKEKHLTQEQLAEKIGVSNKSISRWENGRTMPDMSLYEPLCRELDIQVSELLGGKRLDDSEKIKQGEKSALGILVSKKQLKSLGVFAEILIFVGIVTAITLTAVVAATTIHRIITILIGGFVWTFGLIMKVKTGKALKEIENLQSKSEKQ